MLRRISVLIVFVVLCATGVKGAGTCTATSLSNGFTCVQTVEAHDDSSGTTLATAAFGSALTNPSTIHCLVHEDDNGSTVTLADTALNTYIQDYAKTDGVNSFDKLVIFSALNTHTTGSNIVTATWGAGTAYRGIICVEVTGGKTSSPFDQSASNLQNAASATTSANAVTSTASGTTADAVEIIFGGYSDHNNSAETITAGTGYTLLNSAASTAPLFNYGLEAKTVSSTGAQTATFTHTPAVATICTVTTYKAAAAAASSISHGALGFMP